MSRRAFAASAVVIASTRRCFSETSITNMKASAEVGLPPFRGRAAVAFGLVPASLWALRPTSIRHYGFIETEAGDWWFSERNVIGALPKRYDPVSFWLDDGRDERLIAVDVQVAQEETL